MLPRQDVDSPGEVETGDRHADRAQGQILSGVVMLSVPTFGIEPPDQVLAKHRAAGEADDIGLCIETRLTMDGEEATFGGHLVMLPNQGALRSLLDALKV